MRTIAIFAAWTVGALALTVCAPWLTAVAYPEITQMGTFLGDRVKWC